MILVAFYDKMKDNNQGPGKLIFFPSIEGTPRGIFYNFFLGDDDNKLRP